MSWKKDRQELFSACRGGDLETVRRLSGVGDVRDRDGQSPLHYAALRGLLEVVRYLVTEAHCDANARDNDGWTPLHNACLCGHLEVVRYLVSEVHCDPNYKSKNGWTPLHLACRRNNEAVVEWLLAEGHGDPNYTTEKGSTPLSLANNIAIIRLLLQHGAVAADLYKCSSLLPDGSPREAAQSTISAFMVGDKGAGKSTLTKALTKERASIVRWTGRVSKVSGVKERTAGIECHTVHSSRIGHLSIYDLAGHREFHSAHDTVIRSCTSRLLSGIFLFIINLSDSLEDLKRTVSYWLSFIQSLVCVESSAPVVKPYLMAVGSHADSVKSKQELEEKESIVRSYCDDAENIDFVDYVRVDCRYSESPPLNQLRTHILETHDKLQEKMPKVSTRDHCFHVYLASECGNKPGLQLDSLMRAIESSEFSLKEFLPPTIEALHEACSNLNKRGVMLYIQTQSIESSWIIIDKDILLREVNGSVFAPADFTEHKSLTQTGVVPFSMIRSSFPHFDPQLISDFLVHMEFCRQMTAEDGLKLVTQTHPEYNQEPHFLFPGLTPLDPPPDLWRPNPLISYSDYSSCLVLQCREHQHYLSPRFQQVLLLRLAFTHAFPVEWDEVDTRSPALQQACTLWRNGIKWTTPSSVDALVEMTDTTVVLLLRCGQGKEMQLVKLRAQVMTEIESVKREFCSNAVTTEKFVPNPQYPVETQLSVSVHKVSHAISCHQDSVMFTSHTPLAVSQLLHFEPYAFCNQQCLVDLYSEQLVSCKVTSSFIEGVSSHITSIDDFCTLLNVPLHKVAVLDSSSSDYLKAVRMFQEWQTQSEGTYQCLRQQMDKYSIFSGRNILEIAKITLDSLTPPSALPSTFSHERMLASRPTLQDLQALPTSTGSINVIEAIAVEWQSVGIALSINTDRLHIIQADHPHRVEEACLHMLQWWLDHKTPSWQALIRALRVVKLCVLAHNIETALN